jgi:hypothetical protein
VGLVSVDRGFDRPEGECGTHIRQYLLTTPGLTLERLIWDLKKQIDDPATRTEVAEVASALSFDVAAALDQESVNAEAECGAAIRVCLLTAPMATLEGLIYDLDAQVRNPETDPPTAERAVALALDVARAIYDGEDETARLLDGE